MFSLSWDKALELVERVIGGKPGFAALLRVTCPSAEIQNKIVLGEKTCCCSIFSASAEWQPLLLPETALLMAEPNWVS